MMLKVNVIIILAGLFVAGCAGGPVKLGSSKYTKNYVAKPIKDSSSVFRSCPKKLELSEYKQWTDVVSVATECAARGEWLKTEQLAFYLAELDTESPWASYFLSLVSEKQKKYRRSLWMINLALKQSEGVGLFHYQKARLLWKEQQLEEAIEHLEKATSFAPSFYQAHLFLGQIYSRDAQHKKAVDHLLKAVKGLDSHQVAFLTLGRSYLELNEFALSAQYFQKYSDSNPKDLSVLLILGDLYQIKLNDLKSGYSVYRMIKHSFTTQQVAQISSVDVAAKLTALQVEIKKQEDEDAKKRDISSVKSKEGGN